MHVGKLYELAQELRVLNPDSAHPHWWPQKAMVGTTTWNGSYAGSVSPGAWECEFSWLDRDLGKIEYRGPVPSTGGKAVEIGVQAQLAPTRLTMIANGQIWVDGAEQMNPSTKLVFTPKYQTGNSTVGFPPTLPGFVLSWALTFGFAPVPW